MLDGVEYVRASVAAKRFRYTSDYIGQLCRAKKVNARLVGRSWYVNLASVEKYQTTRHQKTSDDSSKTTHQEVSVRASTKEKHNTVVTGRSAVASRLKSTTLKQLADQERLQAGEVRTLRVSYEPDHGNLFPELTKHVTASPRYLKVAQAEATKLGISGDRDSTASFTPTEMPEISLSGKLSVTEYDDGAESAVTTSEAAPAVASDELTEQASDVSNGIKNKAISPLRADDNDSIHLKIKVAAGKSVQAVTLHQAAQKSSTELTTTSLAPDNLPIGDFSARMSQAKLFEGRSGSITRTFTPESVVKSSTSSARGTALLLSPLIATLLAVVLVGVIFLSSTRMIVSGGEQNSQLVFRMENLFDLLK